MYRDVGQRWLSTQSALRPCWTRPTGPYWPRSHCVVRRDPWPPLTSLLALTTREALRWIGPPTPYPRGPLRYDHVRPLMCMSYDNLL